MVRVWWLAGIFIVHAAEIRRGYLCLPTYAWIGAKRLLSFELLNSQSCHKWNQKTRVPCIRIYCWVRSLANCLHLYKEGTTFKLWERSGFKIVIWVGPTGKAPSCALSKWQEIWITCSRVQLILSSLLPHENSTLFSDNIPKTGWGTPTRQIQ